MYYFEARGIGPCLSAAALYILCDAKFATLLREWYLGASTSANYANSWHSDYRRLKEATLDSKKKKRKKK